jgi:triacylglycerol lipase
MIAVGLFLLRLLRRLFGLREEEAEIDGVRIVYSDGGSGAPLVLLHGLGASRATFDAVAAILLRRYRLIIPDMPNFGESGRSLDGEYGLDAMVRWLETFVAHLGLERFHLGGNSLGGWVAAAYAAKHPDRVQSLWLLSAAGTEEMLDTEMVRAHDEQGLYLLLPRTTEEFEQVMRRIFHKAPPLPYLVKATGARMAAAKFPLHKRIFDHLFERREQYRLEPVLPDITAPTLLMWGEHDQVVPLSVMRRFQELVPRAQRVVLPDVGHVPQMEAPLQAVEAYLRFRDGLA